MKKLLIILSTVIATASAIYSMNEEIEFKIKSDKNLIDWLRAQEQTQYKGHYHHDETYFIKNDETFNTRAYRVRKATCIDGAQKGTEKHTVCYKVCTENSSTRQEYETTVGNVDMIKEINVLEGYATIAMSKNRTVYMFDGLEIVVDSVTNLGDFIEIEVKKKVNSVQEGEDLIINFLKKAGVREFIRYYRSYIEMLTYEQAQKNHKKITIE